MKYTDRIKPNKKTYSRDPYLPFRWKKSRYLKDEKIEEIQAAIYNDQMDKVEEIVYGKKYTHFDKKKAKQIAKGREWVRLEDPLSHFIVCDDCTIYNTQSCKQIKIKLTNRNAFTHIQGYKIAFRVIFEQAGWEYDNDKIFKLYKHKGWPMYDQASGYEKTDRKGPPTWTDINILQ